MQQSHEPFYLLSLFVNIALRRSVVRYQIRTRGILGSRWQSSEQCWGITHTSSNDSLAKVKQPAKLEIMGTVLEARDPTDFIPKDIQLHSQQNQQTEHAYN